MSEVKTRTNQPVLGLEEIEQQLHKLDQTIISVAQPMFIDEDSGHLMCEFETEDVPNHFLYIITGMNAFVITPVSQLGKARCICNLPYDDVGNSMVVRFTFEYSDGKWVITFDDTYRDACADYLEDLGSFSLLTLG